MLHNDRLSLYSMFDQIFEIDSKYENTFETLIASLYNNDVDLQSFTSDELLEKDYQINTENSLISFWHKCCTS